MRSRSRDNMCPRFANHLRPQKEEGAGKTGCALHPRSHVQCASKESAHEHTGSAETLRPSLRNGFMTYIVLSLVNRSLLPPSPPGGVWPLADLTPAFRASGPHDFAVRNTVARPRALARDDAAASTASRPAFRDDREPPLLVGRDTRIMPVIWVGVKFYSENRKLCGIN